MLLRTALMSLLAMAYCQIGYGQYPPRGMAPSAASARPYRPLSHDVAAPATAPAPSAAPLPGAGGYPPTNFTGPPANYGGMAAPYGGPPAGYAAPPMDYGMQAMPADSFPAGAACGDGGCGPGTTNYVPWWHRTFVWSYWKVNGLPSPWCTPGNMMLHVPCNPCSGSYYYFRPYNWFHIQEQQQEAAVYEGDPRNPYDNRVVFDGVYEGL